MKKRLFSLFTSLIMVISLVSVLPTMSVSAKTSGDYEYEILSNDTVEITKYNGSAKTITIPSKIVGKKVTSIGNRAFEYCKTLINITISNGIIKIGADTFFNCTSLTSIIIPNSVTHIGYRAFGDCSNLTTIKIPNSVKTIDYNAFIGCLKLKSITIPNGIETIEYSTFCKCSSLTSITIPDSVTSIAQWAFAGCSNLKSVNIGKRVKTLGAGAFVHCTSLTSVTIPKSVATIYDSFSDCKKLKDIYYTGTKNEWEQIEIYDSENILKNATIHYNVPQEVTNFKTTSTASNSVKLSWNKVSGASGYIIYRYDNTKKTWVRVTKTTTNSNTYTISNLKAGTSYKFAVKAYKTVNGKEITSASYPTVTSVTKPANITKVNFTSSANTVKMSWNKVSGATGYRVYQYNTSTKKWKAVANIKNTNYTFKNLKVGTTYKFTVRAYKNQGGKTYLSPKYTTFTTSTTPSTVSFKLTAGSKKATVKWNKVTGATGYKVYYKTSKNGSWKLLKTTNNKTTSYTKTGLTKGKTYYFTVKAYRTVSGKTYNGSYTTKSLKIK